MSAGNVRGHLEFRLNDAPWSGEILVAVALTDSVRPLLRVGGLHAGGIEVKDGLR